MGTCMFCNSKCDSQADYGKSIVFYECPTCGRYEITKLPYSLDTNNHIAPYLFYHRYSIDDGSELRYHTTMTRAQIEEYKVDQLVKGRTVHPVHMSREIINNWFPKTFAERVDLILLRLDSLTTHIGKQITLSYPEMLSLLFIDRKEIENGNYMWRQESELTMEASYMLRYLSGCEFIMYNYGTDEDESVYVTLQPRGYSRIDVLQKNNTNGRNALVAMKFGEDTKVLRESIRKGITDAGYNAIFIDEVQHNDYITPELLKHIRDSKYVVADLTHQNNVAYFEEGYAMGLGKPVIQLCQDGVKLHFDIAQKNTIIWKTEEEIPQRVKERITATIE